MSDAPKWRRWADVKAARFTPEQLASMKKQCGHPDVRGDSTFYCTEDRDHRGDHVYDVEDRPVPK